MDAGALGVDPSASGTSMGVVGGGAAASRTSEDEMRRDAVGRNDESVERSPVGRTTTTMDATADGRVGAFGHERTTSSIAHALEALDADAAVEMTVEAFMRVNFRDGETMDSDSNAGALTAELEEDVGGVGDSLYAADTDLEEEEEVDPRVGDALNELNESMTECNAMENELQRARWERTRARETAKERLDAVSKKLSSSVRTAVPVFHKRALAQLYQVRSIEALRAYEAAHDAHERAKRRNDELEVELMASSGKFNVELMEACAEAMREVADTAAVKTRATEVHERNTRRAVEATAEAAGLERDRHTAVKRALPFFNAKATGERECADADDRVSELKLAVRQAKARYDAALRALNEISEEVHARREARKAARHGESIDYSAEPKAP
ncbi:SH3-binding 5 [Ostreococcus tauri]|uniref:SH3-binding 5 n=1 Tax=Ostreococcus tauri TaxID=70448 RepID=A0A090MBV7_OSTTA|nr:SH3-binding 5 [Ostreococcus tauri]CEF99579.1 SH3-binding 5 [Ostreococcus tauri]|eukprot:XP_003081912.2 SH3-binding 5 [Ostreococcus tauri]